MCVIRLRPYLLNPSAMQLSESAVSRRHFQSVWANDLHRGAVLSQAGALVSAAAV